MAKKAPRRTAERILEAALDLFNRFGEPNVSTTLVAGELNISPGNLYYHYPAKDELINRLFESYERELNELLHASEGVHDVEDAWFFMHSLFELLWRYRFLYRDLNDLLSKNRHIEKQFQLVLQNTEVTSCPSYVHPQHAPRWFSRLKNERHSWRSTRRAHRAMHTGSAPGSGSMSQRRWAMPRTTHDSSGTM